MKIFVAIWQRTKDLNDHKKNDYYIRCWNCKHESGPTPDLSTAMKLARDHHKICREPNFYTQETRTLISLEITFG